MDKNIKYGEIFTTAEQLFIKYGYKKVSIDEIVQEARMAKGTFYLYFKNKNDLYIKILETYHAQAKDYINNLLITEQDPKIRMYLKLIGSLNFMSQNLIVKEIFLENENYYSETITKKIMIEANQDMMEKLLDKDIDKINVELDLKTVSTINTFFLSLLRYKKFQDEDIFIFAEKLAVVLVNGIFSQEVWEKPDLPFLPCFQTKVIGH